MSYACPPGPPGEKGIEFISTNFVSNEEIPFIYDTGRLVALNDISLSRLNNITWVYKDFEGQVRVYFEIEGWGFTERSKSELEKEISEAIKKILDTHFDRKVVEK